MPAIHLAFHYWKPGWVKPTEDEWRAFGRGLRKPVGEMPEGCQDSVRRRLRDEWWLVGRIWRGRRSEPERARAMVSEHGSRVALHVLRSKRAAKELLNSLRGE